MDPLLDEKLILTASASLIDVTSEQLGVYAVREAYGPTSNEGLCFEYCVKFPFQGKPNGNFYFAMDGYTKLQLIPYVVRNFLSEDDSAPKAIADKALFTMAKEVANMMEEELKEFQEEFCFEEGKILSHKIEKLPSASFRKYMIIFFLKDNYRKKYLGRIYLVLALKKS
ncbi:MAG: chemotaxis protein CheX [Candidatus Hydrogenedentota bacterium]|nr:MAG: chemotaxis protein CheX [Candidatus Hydrogenedentota bacterium]